jgi:hypothetical protein
MSFGAPRKVRIVSSAGIDANDDVRRSLAACFEEVSDDEIPVDNSLELLVGEMLDRAFVGVCTRILALQSVAREQRVKIIKMECPPAPKRPARKTWARPIGKAARRLF